MSRKRGVAYPGSGEAQVQDADQYENEVRRTAPPGLIVRQKEPPVLEMPFDQLDSYLTPTRLFYIRSHFPTPTIDVADYSLRIDGAVRHKLALSYKELRELRPET